MGATTTISEFVAGLGVEGIPDEVAHQGKRCLIDWLGVTLAGSADPSAGVLLAVADEIAPVSQATVLGCGRRIGLLGAALTNGYLSHVLDFDDTFNPARTTVHGSAPVWPAVLGLAEQRGVAGADALVAFVCGFETEVRVALAAGPAHYEAGWHVTGTVGHLGAAAAAARLLGLNPTSVAHALGAAGTQAAGLKGVYGSMGKALHPGKAAMDGLLAALLAAEGFDGSTTILEAKHGFLRVLSPDPDPELVCKDLGERWMLPDDGFKPYACGSLTHPTIEAVIALRAEHDLTASDIVAIEASVNDYVSWVTAKDQPATGLEGKFSIFHCAAVAAVDGAASVGQFTDERVNDPEVVAMRSRVSIVVDDGLAKDAAAVSLTLTDGRALTREIPHNKGTPARPMSDDEIEAKFLELAAASIGEDSARRVAGMCWTLEKQSDAGEIARLCAGVPA
ncbi:MAG: MmgE/PrpD family protein [Actinomycetota bacterium]